MTTSTAMVLHQQGQALRAHDESIAMAWRDLSVLRDDVRRTLRKVDSLERCVDSLLERVRELEDEAPGGGTAAPDSDTLRESLAAAMGAT